MKHRINLGKTKGSADTETIVYIAFFLAWLTHIVTCISDDRWGLLIAGALIFPVGIIHGVGVWFGFF